MSFSALGAYQVTVVVDFLTSFTLYIQNELGFLLIELVFHLQAFNGISGS